MGQAAVGLYVGNDHVDLVEVSGKFQQPILHTFGRAELTKSRIWRRSMKEEGSPQETGEGISPEEEKALTQDIQSLLARTKPTSSLVYTVIPPEAVIVRYFQMPYLSQKDRANAILFEATKYLPYRHEELGKNFHVTHTLRPEKSAAAMMWVTFYAVRKDLLMSYLRALKGAGLSPAAFETIPLSLIRILRQSGRLKAGESLALLFIDRETANITIAGGEISYLSRNIATLAGEKEAKPPDLLEALVNEARVSMDYYRRRFSGEPPVNRILLVGHQVDAKTAEAITQALNTPVELVEPLQGIPGAEGGPPGIAIAAGSALRGLDPARGMLNLLPQGERPVLQTLIQPALAEMAAAFLLLVLYAFMTSQGVKVAREKEALLQQTLQEINLPGDIKAKNSSDLMAFRQGKLKDLRFLKNLTEGKKDIPHLLSKMALSLPESGWLMHLVLENDPFQPTEALSGAEGKAPSMKLLGKVYLGEQGQEVSQVNHMVDRLRKEAALVSFAPSINLDVVRQTEFMGIPLTEFQVTATAGTEKTPGRRS